MCKQWISGSLFPPAPTLEPGRKALAQLSLIFSVDSKSMFVQPDSKPACLLGVNVIPLLDINVIIIIILSHATPEPDVASVSLVKSVTLPHVLVLQQFC